jgi:hypothetical protein
MLTSNSSKRSSKRGVWKKVEGNKELPMAEASPIKSNKNSPVFMEEIKL